MYKVGPISLSVLLLATPAIRIPTNSLTRKRESVSQRKTQTI